MVIEFEKYLRSNTKLSEDDIAKATALAIQKTLHRNELLLQEGQVCRYKTFVATGLLRSFGTVADGSEHILHFSQEHTWIVDAESYDKQTPSQFTIAAIEKSEVLQWTKADFDLLLTDMPELKTFSQQLVSRSNYNSRQRLFTSLSATPEEKYNEFVQRSPELLTRLPLHMIAAYLGISLKTLTRIRHAQVNR